jgi:hypothetical protein
MPYHTLLLPPEISAYLSSSISKTSFHSKRETDDASGRVPFVIDWKQPIIRLSSVTQNPHKYDYLATHHTMGYCPNGTYHDANCPFKIIQLITYKF